MRFAQHGYAFAKITIPLLVGVGLFVIAVPSYGGQLLQRSLATSSAAPGVQAEYKLAFTPESTSNLGSIRLQFCANDPIIGTPCTAPAGFDAQTAALTAQSGETGFTKSVLSTSNVIILSRVPAPALAVPSEYEFSPVTNPGSVGSYYVRLETFASTDATGPHTDAGGLALAITDLLSISAEVPPYLMLCTGIVISALDCSTASGDYADFGVFSPTSTASATSQLLIATNADDGYVVWAAGETLASGNNIINAITSPNVSQAGTAQFGLNLRANSNPPIGADVVGPGSGLPTSAYNQPNKYIFNNGDAIADSATFEDFRKYTISYVVNIPQGQAPGIYVTTLTYIASGNF